MTETYASKITTTMMLASSMGWGSSLNKAPPLRESKDELNGLSSQDALAHARTSPSHDRMSDSGRTSGSAVSMRSDVSERAGTSARPDITAVRSSRPSKISKIVNDSSNIIRLIQINESMAIRKEYESNASINDIVISKYLEGRDYTHSMYTNPCVAAGKGLSTVNTDHDGLYMIQPYFRHGDSTELMAMLTPSARHCMTLKMARRAIECLNFVHAAGVIHADIKPQNFLVDNTGELVLSDFELAIFNTSDSKSRSALRYTRSYRAPEAVDGKVSYSSDVWALGMTIYAWSRGHTLVACDHDDVECMHSTITDALDRNDLSPYMPCDVLIKHMIHPNPAMRPTTAELMAYLDRNMTGTPCTTMRLDGPAPDRGGPSPSIDVLVSDIGNYLVGNPDVEDELDDMVPMLAAYLSGTNMSPHDVNKMLDFLVTVNFDVM